MPRRGALVLLAAAAALPARAQVEAFRHDASRVPVGRVFQYLKSNRDGSRAGRVSLYVAKPERLESLKWDDEVGWATLVIADLDWTRFSVRRFESWKLRQATEPVLQAVMETSPAGDLGVSLLPDPPVRPASWPWHSYDFDFASLGITLAHLRKPEAAFRFERVDFVQKGEAVSFADLGAVNVAYEARESREGKATRRYRISGPGLEGSSGTLWADADRGHIVEFELPIPDEPGFVDGRLRLLEVVPMAPEAWEAFKRSRLGE